MKTRYFGEDLLRPYAPRVLSGSSAAQFAHKGSRNGLITMRRPSAWLLLPRSECSSSSEVIFVSMSRAKSIHERIDRGFDTFGVQFPKRSSGRRLDFHFLQFDGKVFGLNDSAF